MLRALMGKVGNICDNRCIIEAETDILRNKKEMLEIKYTVTELKNAFDRFISRLDSAEKKPL